jgi:hypothetical protein
LRQTAYVVIPAIGSAVTDAARPARTMRRAAMIAATAGQFTAPIVSPTAMIYTVSQFTDSGITTSTLTAIGPDFATDIPEPSAIAVIVTTVGAVATLLARRRFRRNARQTG